MQYFFQIFLDQFVYDIVDVVHMSVLRLVGINLIFQKTQRKNPIELNGMIWTASSEMYNWPQ